MTPDIDDGIQKLQARVEDARGLLHFASRAFVIEFAGTPKSGKSTSVEAIRHFFSRHGFRVHVLTERAALCPIPMKGHLFFNTWCMSTMLAELLANVETETDIIIVDRGLLDALVWLTMQERRGEVTANEASIVESFLLLDRWRRLIDLAVVMSVNAEEAKKREDSQRITQVEGSVMNLDTLSAITSSVDQVVEKYHSRFDGLVKHETTGEDVRESLVRLANNILDHLEDFLNPEILVVPREHIESLPLENGAAFGEESVFTVISCIESHGRYMRRNIAESDFNYVQIIPCAVLAKDDHVFVFKRKETDPKARMYGRATIWRGCHVAKEGTGQIPDRLKNALLERVSRSLFLSRVFGLKPLGYCWDKDEDLSSQHLGLVYRLDIDNPYTATDLKKKEFRKRRGDELTGQFHSLSECANHELSSMLESWSHGILRAMGGTK